MNAEVDPSAVTMLREKYSWIHLARVTIEFSGPFHVGTGRESEGIDALVVRDANGLPAIPGSSIAGVLKRRLPDADRSDAIFGFQSEGNDGCGSRLTVSWACLHDSDDLPIEGIVDPQMIDADPVLANARLLTLRDHVRLGHRGTADDRGKFDREKVCAGHRFTFEVEFIDQLGDSPDWQQVLSAILAPGLRLGARTRSGLGSCRVVRLATGSFDLSKPEHFELYSQHPVELRAGNGSLQPSSTEETSPQGTPPTLSLILHLCARGYWMFGGGDDLDTLPGAADLAPVRDTRIQWQTRADARDRGTVVENVPVIPASSVKGALAHRTAYHYNLASEAFADAWSDNERSDDKLRRLVGENNPAVRTLFGYAASRDEGQAGLVFIEDVFLDQPQPQIFATHNSIDRFTGGTRDGALFSERPFLSGAFRFVVTVAPTEAVRGKVLAAFCSAVDDLAGGRLQLGGGGGRGLGFFEAETKLAWPDDWVKAIRVTASDEPQAAPAP